MARRSSSRPAADIASSCSIPKAWSPRNIWRASGVTAFALKYRLFREPGSKYTIDNTAEDIRRAMRTVRARAAEWNIDPSRIGVMGWSAGGEVAALVAYPPVAGDPKAQDPIERVSARPDFQILIYPGPLGIPDKVPRRCAAAVPVRRRRR